MNNFKSIVDKYYNDRYDWLLKLAENNLAKINKRNYSSQLVSDSYLYLFENESKISEKVILSGMLESIIVNYISYQVIWSKTNLKKNFIPDNYDITENSLIEMDEEEILENEMNIENKLNTIKINLLEADLTTKMVFNLFQAGYNTSGKLAKHTGLSRTGCYNLIKNMKLTLSNTKSIKK